MTASEVDGVLAQVGGGSSRIVAVALLVGPGLGDWLFSSGTATFRTVQGHHEDELI